MPSCMAAWHAWAPAQAACMGDEMQQDAAEVERARVRRPRAQARRALKRALEQVK